MIVKYTVVMSSRAQLINKLANAVRDIVNSFQSSFQTLLFMCSNFAQTPHFDHKFELQGFATTVDGRRQRLDPQDTGAEYRNVIGLPGGIDNAELWPVIEAANTHGMRLRRGTGGTKDDTEDEYVVYVYDSTQYPFFRGEASHQFHPNNVIQRSVPNSYTGQLKQVQTDLGRLDDNGCIEIFADIGTYFSLVMYLGFGSLIGLSSTVFYGMLAKELCLHFFRHLCMVKGGQQRADLDHDQACP